jgi:hypothetical protein
MRQRFNLEKIFDEAIRTLDLIFEKLYNTVCEYELGYYPLRFTARWAQSGYLIRIYG